MGEFNFEVGCGDVTAVTMYARATVISVVKTPLKLPDGKEVTWYKANLALSDTGNLLQNITVSAKSGVEEWQKFHEYDLGFQIIQEIDKRGNSKFNLRVVYAIEPED